VLYICINTHETEKYWYAYDIKVELRQLATLDANPQMKTLAVTWSLNMTGQANIGTLNVIRQDTGVMVGRFVQAWKVGNRK
jgi:arginine/ornithine N-succinyltransferase beta subunit